MKSKGGKAPKMGKGSKVNLKGDAHGGKGIGKRGK